MTTAVKVSGYDALFNKISGRIERARGEITSIAESILLKLYHEIGGDIVNAEKSGEERSGYGKHFIPQLSKDLTAKYGKGFSETNIKYMRQFYLAYPNRQAPDELTWTHYQLLSRIEDAALRKAYDKKAVKEHWTTDKLKEVLTKDQVQQITFDAGEEDAGSAALSMEKAKGLQIHAVRGQLNLYPVADPAKVAHLRPLAQDEIFLDRGFYQYHRLRWTKGAVPQPGDVVELIESPEGRQFKRHAAGALPRGATFTYAAALERVVDGDTLAVGIEDHFGNVARVRLRLNRIDCPELKTAAGKAAREFVVKELAACPFIVIKTHSTDIHARFLVDVYYSSGASDPQKVAADGKLLNQELLDAGHAKLWKEPDLEALAFLN